MYVLFYNFKVHQNALGGRTLCGPAGELIARALLALARWGMGAQFQLGGHYAAELRILLVCLSESLGRLG